jgi:colanic acid/amylovoran biosynthesis glycosyltransferase
MHVAYLCSRYPDVSHTFIQREIVALRELGLEVSTFSVRRARQHQVLSRLDREEFERTYALLPPRPRDHLRAHLGVLRRRPTAWLRTLWRSLRLTPGGGRGTLWRVFYFAEAVMLLDRCERAGVRHVHAHFANVGSDVAQLTAHLGRLLGEPWSWSFTMHGSTEFYEVSAHRLPEKVRDALFVTCVSDFTRSQLMMWVDDTHWHKLRLVRCAVDTGLFRPPEAPRADSPMRVLCVSRLVLGKGLTLLLEALAEVAGEGLEVELVLVGEGPEREAIERRSHELGLDGRVRLTGAIGQDEIRAHYAEASVFCLPSFAEGVPVVLMEAMATGLPVIVTRIAGIPELVDDGESGILVRPARADDLAGALRRLADSAGLRRSMGEAGRRTVIARYDLEPTARELAGVFREELQSASTSGHSPFPPPARRASAASRPR